MIADFLSGATLGAVCYLVISAYHVGTRKLQRRRFWRLQSKG